LNIKLLRTKPEHLPSRTNSKQTDNK